MPRGTGEQHTWGTTYSATDAAAQAPEQASSYGPQGMSDQLYSDTS